MYGSNRYQPYHEGHLCGLYYSVSRPGAVGRTYLPQVDVNIHASILATTSRTELKQTFMNPSSTKGIKEVRYSFPLYDGVSVVGFSCHVGNRLIVGQVKEKEKAKEIFRDAVKRGETAGLLEQLPDAADVFTTTIGNIPPGAKIIVSVAYLGELKHDMEVDGIRFTVPTIICPRYGSIQAAYDESFNQPHGTIAITVDAEMAQGSFIQSLQSPSHPISMSMGTTSVDPDATPSMSRASATLSLGVAHLDTDFVLQIIAKDTGIPKAIIESHPTIPNHRALMATLVPKFALPPEKPEIVFVCDQSGSMSGHNMSLAIEALKVFLKSLPVGIKFNICSFGSRHSFLFPRSASYSQDTLATAFRHAEGLQANYGGTEMLAPLQATIENRYNDMPLDIILLTDGEIWNQQIVFDYLNEQIQEKKHPIRAFTLGIGSGVSHSLIEGIAKAGNGFAQSVQQGEKMNSKVVRMLKGALSPHVNDYTLEVKYSAAEGSDDFEIVEKVADSLKIKLDLKNEEDITQKNKSKKPISLFDTSANPDKADPNADSSTGEERFAHLAPVPAPKILQAPQSIPTLFAFNRTSVYLMLGPDAPRTTPTSVVLRGTSSYGPLELEIPVQVLSVPGTTIHQLAAKRAVSELEQGRGWLASARDTDGQLLKTRFDGRFSDMVEREAVRLGVQFQVGGKWCSFVATEQRVVESTNGETMDEEDDWDFLEDQLPTASSGPAQLSKTVFAKRRRQVPGQRELLSVRQEPCQPSGLDPVMMRRKNMMRQQQASQQSGLFGVASSAVQMSQSSQTAAPGSLQAYQTGLMILEQQNKNRLRMVPAGGSTANEEPPRAKRVALGASRPELHYSENSDGPTGNFAFGGGGEATSISSGFDMNLAGGDGEIQNFDFDSFLHDGNAPFSPLSQIYSPASPASSPTSPGRASASSSNSAAVQSFAPTAASYNPAFAAPASPSFDAASPPYSPKSPSYAPQSPSLPNKTPPPPSPPRPSTQATDTETLHALIAHQSFSGCFPHHAHVLDWLHIPASAYRACWQQTCANLSKVDQADGANLLTTALVLVYLETQLQRFQGEWELVADKARSWLEEKSRGREGGAELFLDAARRLVGSRAG